MLVEERKHLVPAVERLLRAIGGASGVEKGMAGAVIAVELIGLAQLLEHGFGAVHLVTVGIFIIVAEQAEQRTAQFCRQIDRCDRPLGIELLGIVDDDIAAPAIHRRVDAVERAGCEISVSPSGAEADHSDLAVGVGLSAQVLRRARDVAQNLLVGDAAGRAYAGADIIGTARTFAEIEMRRDGRQSMPGWDEWIKEVARKLAHHERRCGRGLLRAPARRVVAGRGAHPSWPRKAMVSASMLS